jgi:hypothetical protein
MRIAPTETNLRGIIIHVYRLLARVHLLIGIPVCFTRACPVALQMASVELGVRVETGRGVYVCV